ncbi:MAG: AarF/ABC1/UbiB kinase family protein [Pseudanabaenaceae cyanobacterium bins.68]|nr:AarF/ABC1/UbiB kinase family protein [Pseudanabaenaceae cyanobacterium bins.68]
MPSSVAQSVSSLVNHGDRSRPMLSSDSNLMVTESTYAWSRDRYSPLLRTIDIWRTVLMFLLMLQIDRYNWSYIGGKTEIKLKKRRRSRAAWLREAMLQLGPTFIKIGQLLSSRADILPSESVEELAKLQDRVPAFSYDKTRQILEADLDKPISTAFAYFETTPLAAASLGQVHRAKLHSGEEVVVKVQRPGLLKLFEIDLGILKKIVTYFQNHPRYGKGRDWLGIYGECSRILYQEADYLNEGRNADTFRRNFRQDLRIVVPKVYWRFTARRVLTLEYLPGIKISNYAALEAAGIDRQALAKIGAESYLQQLLNHGFFHADPHPGNLAVTQAGKLIFYDFGMMGQIQPITREKLLQTFFGIAQRDAARVVQALIELGALEASGDLSPVRRSVQYLLDNFMGQSLEKQSVAAISEDLYEIAYDQPFRFPATFTFVMRALSTLEGLGKGLDPSFDFMEVAKPFAVNLMENGNLGNAMSSAFWGELGKQATQVSNSAINLPRKLEETIAKLENGDIRLRVRSQESDRLLRRLGNIGVGMIYALFSSVLLLSGTILWVNSWQWLAAGALALSMWAGLALVRLLGRLE